MTMEVKSILGIGEAEKERVIEKNFGKTIKDTKVYIKDGQIVTGTPVLKATNIRFKRRK